MDSFDLIVIGSGPAGEKAAVKAAYFNHKVAIVEGQKQHGGAGILTGTLPSKALRETAVYYSGKYDRGVYGKDKSFDGLPSIDEFMFRKNNARDSESAGMKQNLIDHGVKIFCGKASFVDPHKVRIASSQGKEQTIEGHRILIATGSYPVHPEHIDFDHKRVHDSDSILTIERFPTSIAILGAGVIGCEYSTIFATMGIKTYLINHHSKLLPFLDNEISEHLVSAMESNHIELLFEESIKSIEKKGEKKPLTLHLESGKSIQTDMFLFAAGRSGNIQSLNLEKIGVELGKRETVKVNEFYQTNLAHIYAVGDVIGFPALASTSMDQGRVAVAHMFQMEDIRSLSSSLPFAIYTIPELATIGLSEEEAQSKKIEYGVGYAYYSDIPRGKIMGVKDGFLKLTFSQKDQTILGVHIVGAFASELIHYGIILVEQKISLSEVILRVFNFPTLHEMYKYACYDGLSFLSGKRLKKHHKQTT